MSENQTIETPMAEAEKIIYGDREKTYGDPSKNLSRIAEMWEAYLQVKLREWLGNNISHIRGRIIAETQFGVSQPTTVVLARQLVKNNGLDIDIRDVCHMMQLLKWARDENTPKRDNVVDDIGYAGLIHRCRTPSYEQSIPTGVMKDPLNTDAIGKMVEEYQKLEKTRKQTPIKRKRKARK